MGRPQSLFRLFSVFSIKFYNLRQKCPSSIWRQDSNSQPSDHEYPSLTTAPGLPLSFYRTYLCKQKCQKSSMFTMLKRK